MVTPELLLVLAGEFALELPSDLLLEFSWELPLEPASEFSPDFAPESEALLADRITLRGCRNAASPSMGDKPRRIVMPQRAISIVLSVLSTCANQDGCRTPRLCTEVHDSRPCVMGTTIPNAHETRGQQQSALLRESKNENLQYPGLSGMSPAANEAGN